MPRANRSVVLAAVLPAIVAAGLILARHSIAAPSATEAARLRITYPAEGTLFPPDSVAPTLLWTDETAHVDRWTITVRDHAGADVLTTSVDAPAGTRTRWNPASERIGSPAARPPRT